MSDKLFATERLLPGDQLKSENGDHTFIFQRDGNLVLLRNGKVYWNSGTAGKAAEMLVMQTDGNLVLYGYDRSDLWTSKTSGGGNTSFFYIQNDGKQRHPY